MSSTSFYSFTGIGSKVPTNDLAAYLEQSVKQIETATASAEDVRSQAEYWKNSIESMNEGTQERLNTAEAKINDARAAQEDADIAASAATDAKSDAQMAEQLALSHKEDAKASQDLAQSAEQNVITMSEGIAYRTLDSFSSVSSEDLAGVGAVVLKYGIQPGDNKGGVFTRNESVTGPHNPPGVLVSNDGSYFTPSASLPTSVEVDTWSAANNSYIPDNVETLIIKGGVSKLDSDGGTWSFDPDDTTSEHRPPEVIKSTNGRRFKPVYPIRYKTVSEMVNSHEGPRRVGTIVEAGGLRFESVSSDEDIQTQGDAKLRALPSSGDTATLQQFGCAVDGVTDDSVAFKRAIKIASSVGIKKLLIGGTCSVGDITIASMDVSINVVGGFLLFNGSSHILRLNSCSGNVRFEDVIVDGGQRTSSDHLLRATDDANLTVEFIKGAFINLGSKSLNSVSGGAIRVSDANGIVRDTALGSIFGKSKQIFGFGFGAMGADGVYTQRDAKLYGNLFRLGLIGPGSRRTSQAFVRNCRCIDIYDPNELAGQYGNMVSVYRAEGVSVTGNVFRMVFASGVRFYDARGVVTNNTIYDASLAGIYIEFGSEGSVVTSNILYGCGTDGIAVANPENISTGVTNTTVSGNIVIRSGYLQTYSRAALPPSFLSGYPAYLISDEHSSWANGIEYNEGDISVGDDDTTYLCNVSHTSSASGTFSDERSSSPELWTEVEQGRNRASGITGTFGCYQANDIIGVNACSTGESVGLRGGAQAFNGPLFFGQNQIYDVDYMVGFGESDNRHAPISIAGLRGTYRKSPITQLGGYYSINAGFSGSGKDCTITDIICPPDLRPSSAEPGSWMIDPNSGLTYRWQGAGAYFSEGAWSDTIENTGGNIDIGSRHVGRVIRCIVSSPNTQIITLPSENTESIPIGSEFTILIVNNGDVELVAGVDASVNGLLSYSGVSGSVQEIKVRKTFTNTFDVIG